MNLHADFQYVKNANSFTVHQNDAKSAAASLNGKQHGAAKNALLGSGRLGPDKIDLSGFPTKEHLTFGSFQLPDVGHGVDVGAG